MERVELETILPPEPLRPFVRRYLYANRRLASPVTFNGSPTGYSYFSNFLGQAGDASGSLNGRAFERVTRWFLFGQTTDHQARFHHANSLRLIVGELAATGHHRLFGMSGQKILGLAAPLEEAAPEKVALARQCFVLGPESSEADHVAEANAFFCRLAEQALPADPLVERAVGMLETSNGAMRISELCARLDVDPRKLNRSFRGIVGISPKFFGRIMQINRVVDLLYSGGDSELAQTAQDAGFYDQAHFNHAMQRFFREGPRAFLRSDHHAFESFLAGSRRFGPTSAR